MYIDIRDDDQVDDYIITVVPVNKSSLWQYLHSRAIPWLNSACHNSAS